MKAWNVVGNRTQKLNHTSEINTMGPLRWLLRIFALNSIDLKKKSHGKTCTLACKVITAAALGLVNFYTLYYKVRYIYSDINVSIKLTDAVQCVFDYFQYIIDLYFVNKYGREIGMQYQKQYESIDKILDMGHDSFVKKRETRLIGVFAFLWLTSSMCDFAAWCVGYGWIVPLAFAMGYIFLLIKIVTTLDLTVQVIHVECRLRLMGDLVLTYYESAEYLSTSDSTKNLFGDAIRNENWFYSEGCFRVIDTRPDPLKAHACNDYHEFKWLSRCYLVLKEQCTFVNNMFGFRILLNCLSILIDMVRFANIAVRIVLGSQLTTYDAGYFPAVSSLFRLLTCAAVLTSLVVHCEGAYRQQDRIVCVIDHILINKNPSAELRSAARELRGLVESRPICFNMANFFTLNYPFLVSTASVVVTYTIILLQNMN